ncbi:MAG: Glycosyl transferase, family 2, partial [Candidatus Gallionella acididurans]
MNPNGITAVTGPKIAPPIRRGSMVPRPWTGFWRGLWIALFRRTGLIQGADHPSPSWKTAASVRRMALAVLVIASGVLAASLLYHTEMVGSSNPVLHFIQLVLFALLLG